MVEVGEEDIRNLAARHQEFQRQAEGLKQQMNMASSGMTIKTIPTVIPRVVQVVLVRLPKSQKTMAWTCSGFAVYSRSASKESNRNRTAIPVSTMVSEVARLNLAMLYIAMRPVAIEVGYTELRNSKQKQQPDCRP